MLRMFLTLGLFFFVGLGSASAQISIRNFTEATNNRFTNDASFIGTGFDFSGVARGTLIAPNAVLTAQHFRPSVTSTLRFYPSNDPNSTPYEAIVTGSTQVGSSDLSIVFLDRNVNPSIAVYRFATEEYSGDEPLTIVNPDGSTSTQHFFNTNTNGRDRVDIIGERAFVFGVSASDNPSTFTDQAVGENLVYAFSENVVFGSNTDNDSIILENDDVGSANALTYETHVRGGDSGAPNFIVDSATNELVLLGVNSFRFDSAAPGTFQSSGVTYTGNQVAEINAILAANIIEPNCNLDGVVNFLDISQFIILISTNDYLEEADINVDGIVNFLDIRPFILLLN